MKFTSNEPMHADAWQENDVAFLPLLPLREVVIFPGAIAPLFVGRSASIKAIEAVNAEFSRLIFLVTQKNSYAQTPIDVELYSMGVVCRILQLLRLPDGTIKILCEGIYRAIWDDIQNKGTYSIVHIQRVIETEKETNEKNALVRAVHEALEEYGKNESRISQETLLSIKAFKEPGTLADAILAHLKIDYHKKQEALEIIDKIERLERAYELLVEDAELITIEQRIKTRVKNQMELNQREYYLTEQIKAINKEMGREEDPQAEISIIEQKIKELNMPEKDREKALSEVKKLHTMPIASSEYAVIRNYIDWIIDLPWHNLKPINIDISHARLILDNAHHGLEKPKERILEYLATQKLSNCLKGPILCFVGPPGVGKTSLAKSVAEATDREFVRLSLGGVRDEAEIRGHRRTYVGALPGKIIQSLKRVHFNNPLFCLDEIDKISSDYHGDPASALLEVLDPEQNHAFMDHYLDIEYDLSRIFFITTANNLHTIPSPLLDRMEIIELPSYLETEKHSIAGKFLLPRQIKEHGLKSNNLNISDNALLEIIRKYTREAGVRGLEREIATICRKTAIDIVESNNLDKTIIVSENNLSDFLGVQKYQHEERESTPQTGVCAGLAYNQSGGDILFVETCIMIGSGNVVTTGQLGDVMIESAKAAISYIRSRAIALGLDTGFYKKIDIHVHVPAGATPKDGPSAGITLATSIASALLGIPVHNDIAMTGEISLRGRVLPIGGLREKLLAARRSGIKKVIIPKDNEKDISEVPEEITKDLQIIYVKHVDEVLPIALMAENEKIFVKQHSRSNLSELLRSRKSNTHKQKILKPLPRSNY